MNEPAIAVAMGIVMVRRGCNRDEAFAVLTEAANDYDMSVSELAECLLAERQLRWQSRTSPG